QLGPLSPTDLARRMGFTTGGITTVIDRLERAGYVRRAPDLDDRRRLLLEATEVTAERDRSVFGELGRRMVGGLAGSSARELKVIRTFLDRTREITGRYASELGDAGSEPEAERTR